MSRGIPTKVIGAVLGLAGFIIAIVAGMAAGNDAGTTLLRALLALIGCNAVGLAIGAAGERVIHEHITSYQHARSAEESDRDVSADPDESDEGILVV